MRSIIEEKIEIFLCYAHEDRTHMLALEKQLRVLQRQNYIDLWHDREISAGAEWEYEVTKHLNSAELILLLISPDFIDSDYCYGVEMKQAMKLHEQGTTCVIPIILRPVFWQKTPFGKLQALPTDGLPVTDPAWHQLDRAFFNVAEGIRKKVEQIRLNAAVQRFRETLNSGSLTQIEEIYNHRTFNDEDLTKEELKQASLACQLMEAYRRSDDDAIAIIVRKWKASASLEFICIDDRKNIIDPAVRRSNLLKELCSALATGERQKIVAAYRSIDSIVDVMKHLTQSEQELLAITVGNSITGTYQQPWVSSHPGYIIFLIDQSGPMAERLGQSAKGLSDMVARIVNDVLNELITYNSVERNGLVGVKPRVDITVLGYSNGKVTSLLSYISSEREVFTLPELQGSPLQIEIRRQKDTDDMGHEYEMEVPFPIWIQPKAAGNAPMCMSLQRAKELAEQWVSNHPVCYPPVVCHMTRGVADDGDPLLPAFQLRTASTTDGQTLLYNALLSNGTDAPVAYPSNINKLPFDRLPRKLFAMSSLIPEFHRFLLQEIFGREVLADARGYVHNGDFTALILALTHMGEERPNLLPLDPNL